MNMTSNIDRLSFPKHNGSASSLERMYCRKFSKLTIDDEYRYNLEYLVYDGPKNVSNHSSGNSLVTQNKIRPTENVYPKPSASSNHVENKVLQSNVNGVTLQPAAPVEKRLSMYRSSLNNVQKINGHLNDKCRSLYENKAIETQHFRRNSLTLSHPVSESSFPSLHIYVADSQPLSPAELSGHNTPSPKGFKKTVNYRQPPVLRQPVSSVVEKLQKRDMDSKYTDNHQKNRILPKNHENNLDLYREEPTGYAIAIHKSKHPQKITVSSNKDLRLIDDNESQSNMHFCFTCRKQVYPIDRVSTGDRVFHRNCFRCMVCQRIVLPGTFAAIDGAIFCKPHYMEHFRLTGRYDHHTYNYRNFAE